MDQFDRALYLVLLMRELPPEDRNTVERLLVLLAQGDREARGWLHDFTAGRLSCDELTARLTAIQ